VNDSNFLKEIGRSYIISAFLPAAIFILLAYFLFAGFIPKSLAAQISIGTLFRDYQWIILFLFTLWSAFCLFSANDLIVRFYEGYYLPEKIKKSKVKIFRAKWDKEYKKYLEWQDYSQKIQSKIDKKRVIQASELEKLANLLLDAQSALANLSIGYPLDPEKLMPTRLGNVLRASEMYAYERYAIAQVSIWPRLAPFLPAHFARNLEEKDNHFMFLINTSFLSQVMTLICLSIGIIGSILAGISYFYNDLAIFFAGFFLVGFDFLPFWSFFFLGAVFLGFSYVMYGISVNVAEDYGTYIRTSYDLYRAELLRQMRWKPPKTIDEEKLIWENISRYIIAANRLGVELPDFYQDDLQDNLNVTQLLTPKTEQERWPGQ